MDVPVDRKWLMAGGIGLIAVVAVVLAVLIASGDDASPKGAAASKGIEHEAVVEGQDLQRCVALWNRSANAGSQSSVSVLIADFVSVTTSDLYPGKCLVTAVNSQLNLSAQFLESASEYDQVASGEATTLPVSVTGWNANADSSGYISLNE